MTTSIYFDEEISNAGMVGVYIGGVRKGCLLSADGKLWASDGVPHVPIPDNLAPTLEVMKLAIRGGNHDS